jgi:HAD superfamily hydrolase (TIGR01509 family)
MRLPSQIGVGRQRDGRALKAIVFDFDGVLADSEPLHFQAFHTVFAEQGVALTEKDYADRYVGLSDAECVRKVMLANGKSATGPEVDEWVGRKTQFMQHLLRSAHVIVPGIPEFLNEAANHYRLAIASGARKEEVYLVLRRAGLLDVFEQIVTSEDVERGKPDPDVYLLALTLLNDAGRLMGSECLAVEDTPHGIHAAHAAGMRCLAVSTTVRAEVLFQADAVTASLTRFDFPAFVERWWPGSYRYGRSGKGRKHNQPSYREARSG